MELLHGRGVTRGVTLPTSSFVVCERNHDLLTRSAEMMLQRAELGTQWLIVARLYAQWLLNRSPRKESDVSRQEAYIHGCGEAAGPVCRTSKVPVTFGTTVSIVEDVRGPKGSLDHPRGSIGRMMGIVGSSYLVWRPARRSAVYQYLS